MAGPAARVPARVIDCNGLTLMPGLVDSHCHLLALGSTLRGLDCGPQAASSIPALQQLVRSRADLTPPGGWIRGFGYDDNALAERRHPYRWDLDPVAGGHPVRLDHRSRHASVLNSRGLELLGITSETPDPVEGVIDRDPASGTPTGLLLEMGDFLRRRLDTAHDPGALKRWSSAAQSKTARVRHHFSARCRTRQRPQSVGNLPGVEIFRSVVLPRDHDGRL